MNHLDLVSYLSPKRVKHYKRTCVAPNARHYPKWVLVASVNKTQQELGKLKALRKSSRGRALDKAKRRKLYILTGRWLSQRIDVESRDMLGFLSRELLMQPCMLKTPTGQEAQLELCARYAIAGYFILRRGRVKFE